MHFTPIFSLPGDDPEDIPTLDDLARVWALAENDDAPDYCVHISRIMTAVEVRETVAQLLSFVNRIKAQPASAGPLTRAQADRLLDLAQAARRRWR